MRATSPYVATRPAGIRLTTARTRARKSEAMMSERVVPRPAAGGPNKHLIQRGEAHRPLHDRGPGGAALDLTDRRQNGRGSRNRQDSIRRPRRLRCSRHPGYPGWSSIVPLRDRKRPPQSILGPAQDVVPGKRLADVFTRVREIRRLSVPVPAQAAAEVRDHVASSPARPKAIAGRDFDWRDLDLHVNAERKNLIVMNEHALTALAEVRQAQADKPLLGKHDLDAAAEEHA